MFCLRVYKYIYLYHLQHIGKIVCGEFDTGYWLIASSPGFYTQVAFQPTGPAIVESQLIYSATFVLKDRRRTFRPHWVVHINYVLTHCELLNTLLCSSRNQEFSYFTTFIPHSEVIRNESIFCYL